MTFRRTFRSKLIKKLQSEDLFQNFLKNDVQNLKVFPAIRNDYIDFYYKGSRLFEYNGEFKTHKKFLSLIKTKDYVTESMLSNAAIIKNFDEQYDEIKSNSQQYPGIEAIGVSYLYSRYSFLNSKSNTVVLDIEIAFRSPAKGKKIDRIDLLLLSKKEKRLKFVEAKHFSNSELWSTTTPDFIEQIIRYNKQIANKKGSILSAYSEYIKINNKLFGTILPLPQKVDPECGLYVFGFDNKQKEKVDNQFQASIHSKGIKYYARGDYKKADANTLWNQL